MSASTSNSSKSVDSDATSDDVGTASSTGPATNTVDIYARHQDASRVDEQIASCRSYARSIGVDVHEEHRDVGGSGAATERRILAQLLSNVRSRLIDGVIVETLDRLSRDEASLHAIATLCRQHGVSVHESSSGTIVDAPPAPVGTMAEAACDAMVARTTMGKHAAAEKGRTSALPFGYSPDPTRRGVRRLHPKRAAAVKRLYDMRASGAGLIELAQWMSGRHPTPAACLRIDRGKASEVRPAGWTPSMIGTLIRSPIYSGVLITTFGASVRDAGTTLGARPSAVKDRVVVRNEDLRIVNDELWLRAQGRGRSRPPHPTDRTA